MSGLPVDNVRMASLGLAGVLLLLLVIVLILLVRALRTQKAVAETAVPAAEYRHDDEADLTRLRVFTPDLLPRLSLDDPDAEDEPVTEDSSPVLHFEGDSQVGVDEPTGQHELIVTAAAGQTDRGIKRRRNEDACLVDPALDLYVVADGMGGYAGGDVASTMAVKEVHESIRSNKPGMGDTSFPRRGRELVGAIERANEAIYGAASKRSELMGMGTTVVTARFSRRKQRVYVAHVGDSRVYRLRGGEFQLLTTDHTLGAKGVTGPLSSNVRRAVGVSASVKVDILVDKPQHDDLYLLCSDGMYKMLSKEQIVRILSEQRSDLSRAAAALIAASNAAGGKDNITVVVVDVKKSPVAGQNDTKRAEVRA